jgi:hypothetical protein
MQEIMDSNPTILNHECYESNKNELEKIEQEERNSILFRTKIKWTEDGEKNSKTFSLEKNNYINKLITTLNVDGKLIKNSSEISVAQSNFYRNLYSEKLDSIDQEYHNNIETFLTNNNMTKLNENETNYCDQPISESEILNSIKKLANGRTPGSDGLPSDWYKFFWCDIKDLLCDSINYAMDRGELSIEQKCGIITLLPKKQTKQTLFRELEAHQSTKYRLQDYCKNISNQNAKCFTFCYK